MTNTNSNTQQFDVKKLVPTFDLWLCALLGFGLDTVTLAAATGHKLLLPDEVDRICAQEHRKGEGLVAGLIARRSVSILVGDSGLGKSPLAYQLGICVAAGLPFLGMETKSGNVVYVDYENELEESQAVRARLVGFLGLEKAPDNFLLWTPEHADSPDIAGICSGQLKPALVILDSLRAHDPDFEQTRNAPDGMKRLRSAAYKNGVAILAIHHIRKPGENGVPPLDNDDTRLMEWLNQASGHRSLVNQSDTRIAADVAKRAGDAAMILRWHRRLRSEGGPLYLERVSDGEGEPIGYRRAVGVTLLGNTHQAEAYGRLPKEFTFKIAKQTYDRTDDPTQKWLVRCEAFGLVKKITRGLYRRLPQV